MKLLQIVFALFLSCAKEGDQKWEKVSEECVTQLRYSIALNERLHAEWLKSEKTLRTSLSSCVEFACHCSPNDGGLWDGRCGIEQNVSTDGGVEPWRCIDYPW